MDIFLSKGMSALGVDTPYTESKGQISVQKLPIIFTVLEHFTFILLPVKSNPMLHANYI